MKKVLDFCKEVILKNGKVNIGLDATSGRGNDTLFLSNICNKVYAFDIQEEAVNSTKKVLLENNVKNVEIFLDSHENFDKYITEEIDVVMFNLGYLPKGDKTITTNYLSTKRTIEKLLLKLTINGLMTIIIYPGHEEGYKESVEISKYLSTLDQHKYDVLKYEFINQINNPPYLIVVKRIGAETGVKN